MKPLTPWQRRPATLLARLIDSPDLVGQVRRLPTSSFSALLRQVGVEDAGELVALATTEQIVAAFDEDLFGNEAPGERERFDPDRFVIWLQVLLEAGDATAAQRVSELSEDFVIGALTHLVLVLDHDALLARIGEGDHAAIYADKALESALAQEIDGYLLIARNHEGWDSLLALLLALDQNHRPLLERLLDRCAALASSYVEDLHRLTTVLSDEESLAEDVEAEREDRRSRQGYVEPRAARSYLALAKEPPPEADSGSSPRDPITRAYFRELVPPTSPAAGAPRVSERPLDLLFVVAAADGEAPALTSGPAGPDTSGPGDPVSPLTQAMRQLQDSDPDLFAERLSELTYLANVLVAGAPVEDRCLSPAEATEAVLATVALGAELEIRQMCSPEQSAPTLATAADLHPILTTCQADLLFRKASAALAACGTPGGRLGFLRSAAQLPQMLALIF